MELQGAGGWTPSPRQGGAAPPPPRGGGSPISDDGRRSTMSSDAADYSETARLVLSSALSDDGMTPLIQVRACRWRRSAGGVAACPALAPGQVAACMSQAPGSSATHHTASNTLAHHCSLTSSPLLPPQPALSRRRRALLLGRRVLSFLAAHWSKAAILGVIITLIVLVSVKVGGWSKLWCVVAACRVFWQ